jgi:hypothetical protein
MKERPILFSAPMVRALLDGSKTQTRRIVKLSSKSIIYDLTAAWSDGAAKSQYLHVPFQHKNDAIGDSTCTRISCPYGAIGDRLWVRETWSHDAATIEECRASHEDMLAGGISYGPYYRATEIAPETLSWKPSIHMPRWASRINLEITGVCVERLQDINEADAMAEGAAGYEEGIDAPPPDENHEWSFRASYQRLWESINGDGSWAANPWVWIVEFNRVTA